jgi:DNA-binding CsgD family transcriptional regulator
MQLRQALAQAEALLREKDLQIHALLARREVAANHLAGLTRRQRQIMELILAGQPSKNIAADLGISQRTVENHRAAIMKKTGSTCLPALARMALAAGWNDAAAPPPTDGWRNTEGPDFAPADQAPADWCRGSATDWLRRVGMPRTGRGQPATASLVFRVRQCQTAGRVHPSQTSRHQHGAEANE